MDPSNYGSKDEARGGVRNLAEQLHHDERRRRRVATVVALAAIGTTIGASVFAWSLWNDRKAARARNAALEKDNRSLSDALELHRASKVELDTRLTTCKRDLRVEKSTSTVTGTELVACRASQSDLQSHKAKSEALLKEFKSLSSKFQGMIDSGKLDVHFRRGQMVVKLPAQVLFPSGKATLSKRGSKALAEVATILRTMRNRRFFVAGHTDNVPISGEFANNWELSTARAVRVTTMLIENGVRPRSLAAAGYGQYMPVASNRTAAGRQKNRRIEIILEPDLRKLPLDELVD